MNLFDLLNIKIGPYEIRGELLVLILIMVWVIFVSVCFSCLRVKIGIEEGFDIIKNVVENGASATENQPPIYNPATPLLSSDLNVYPRTSVAPSDNLAVLGAGPDAGGSLGAEYKQTQTYKIPNASRMDIMASSSFKPECCPSTYATNVGCACMTPEQNVFISERGGNNYPKSEY